MAFRHLADTFPNVSDTFPTPARHPSLQIPTLFRHFSSSALVQLQAIAAKRWATKEEKKIAMKRTYLNKDEISRLKWIGIPDSQLEEFEARQRERVAALEQLLNTERTELQAIINARSVSADGQDHEHKFGSLAAPAHYSTKMTWKDKIIQVVKEAKRPMLAREIGPVLLQWEPQTLSPHTIDNAVSVHLTRLVRDGVLKRVKRNGQSGALYSLVE